MCEINMAGWCRDCGLSLALSENPLDLGYGFALCDICQGMTQAKLGDEELEYRVLMIREDIEALENELSATRKEIRSLKETIEELEDDEERLVSEIDDLYSKMCC